MALVVLVGLPGSGKTTVGRSLATVLERTFVDTDDLFAEREGVSVQDYLRSHSEESFRERELLALRAALNSHDVVATGGGVVITPEARQLLSEEMTVWLDCPDEELRSRVRAGDRPLLGDDPAARLSELRAQREALYAAVARVRVDARGPFEEVVTRLRTVVESAGTP